MDYHQRNNLNPTSSQNSTRRKIARPQSALQTSSYSARPQRPITERHSNRDLSGDYQAHRVLLTNDEDMASLHFNKIANATP